MKEIREVIRKEGNEIVLYSSDGTKVLGRFPFGPGQPYEDEDAARAAAHKREGQIQFFKKHGEALGPAVRRTVAEFCDQAVPLLESAAFREAGVDAIIAKWKAWAGSYRKCVEVLSGKADISEPEALCAWLHHEAEGIWPGDTPPPGPNPKEVYVPDVSGLLAEAGQVRSALAEVGARHTQAEIKLIDRVIRYLEIIRDGEITPDEAEELRTMGIDVKPTTESAQDAAPADSFEDKARVVYNAWRTLYPWSPDAPSPDVIGTYEGYVIVRDGSAYFQVSYQVGEDGVVTFSGRDAWAPVELTWQPIGVAGEAQAAESARGPVDLVYTATVYEAAVDDAGNLDCVLIGAGESANGNVYSPEVLEAAAPLFVGVQMYADHPTRSEEYERPERSVRDLVGRVIEARYEDGKIRARAKLSAAAGWLKTLIREGIAGDLSINAQGRGRKENGKFIVEAITAARSADFVTTGAARGRVLAVLEAYRPDSWAGLTIEDLAEHRPDILNEIASRERDKLYRGKEETLREAQAAPVLRAELESTKKRIAELEKQLEAYAVTDVVEQLLREEVALPEAAKNEVRRQLAGASLADAPARTVGAIQAQKSIVAQVLEAGTVRGHGSAAGGENEAYNRLVAAYIAGGLTPEQAAIAARGRM